MPAVAPADRWVPRTSRGMTGELEVERFGPLLLPRPFDHHPRIALQRAQRLAGPGPVGLLGEVEVVAGFAAGAGSEQRARDVDHLRRAGALVEQGRAAAGAEAAGGPRLGVLVAADVVL